MATKYAVYELKKVKGKKEYTVSRVVSVKNSLNAAYRELERYWEDCLDSPVWFNKKTREPVAYVHYDDRMLYVPNMKEVEEDGVLEPKLIGIYGRKPIFYIDEYPNPYTYYKLHKSRAAYNSHFTLEGVQ